MAEISAAYTPPLSHASNASNIHKSKGSLEPFGQYSLERLRQQVSSHLLSRAVIDQEFVFGKGVSDEVVLNVDVLSPGT